MAAGFKYLVDGQLVIDALFDFLVFCENLVVNDLDCKEVAVVQMPSLKHLTVGAMAQEVPQLVSADYSTHLHFSHS